MDNLYITVQNTILFFTGEYLQSSPDVLALMTTLVTIMIVYGIVLLPMRWVIELIFKRKGKQR